MASSGVKGRNWSLILYPNTTDYDFDTVLVNYITFCNEKGYSYYYILHDEDIKENGEKDAPHYHFLIIMPSDGSDTTLDHIANVGPIASNYIKKLKGIKINILYLAHESPNSKEKYNYDWHSIKTNNDNYLKGVFSNDEEQRNIYAIIDYIDSVGYVTYIDFSKFILSQNLWSYYRRSGAIINNVIKEHNNKYVKYKKKEDLYID